MRHLSALKVLFLVVFVGWIFIWILLPTSAYTQKWVSKLDTRLKSTYFGSQGPNLLLFTFPMMFVAALGCVYLHFQEKLNYSSSKSIGTRWGFWKKPVLVMAPIGIVTAMELAFAAMFTALLVWSLTNYLHFSFGHLYYYGHRQGEKVWQTKLRSISLRLGYIGNICWAFLFFPVTRGSSILPLVGLTSESSIRYHIWLGHLSMVLFSAHTVGFIIYWVITHQTALLLEWSSMWVSNVAGEIAIIFALAIWVTSLPRVRRKMFEVFFYTHHLYILYIFFYVLHVGAAYFCMILPGVFLFVIDRYLRLLQSRRRAKLDSARTLSCGTLELSFAKCPGLTYNPTSILFINVPSISKLQWHPFTITSNSSLEADKLSIIVKSEGSWSQKLYKELSSSLDHLEVSVEGPYGPSSSHFLRHDSLVMVSGGSGIAPFISIIREILFQGSKQKTEIPSILLVCAFRNSADLAMLELLLPISVNPTEISQNIKLQIEAYVTREEGQPKTDQNTQTIWFKPGPFDSPITAAIGPNSWLWLGAIITSSFFMFLLLLGIITRYHIYPIDHNTDMIYHFSYKCLWDMFLVCACSFTVATAGFVWHKRANAVEMKKIQNMEVRTPSASPGPVDRELESFPKQLFIEASNVHFGARPDLKRILLECKESDVGVLVCGPRKMRHEVAKICSSGLANNLHFEAISFNW